MNTPRRYKHDNAAKQNCRLDNAMFSSSSVETKVKKKMKIQWKKISFVVCVDGFVFDVEKSKTYLR